MAKQIRMPDRAKRLYTEKDYMDALYSAGGDEKLALMQEEERGCGFGFMYMKLVHEALDASKNPALRRNQRELNDLAMEAGPEVVKGMINDEFSRVRQRVSAALNRYANRRGMIDVWPQHDVRAGVTVHGWEKNKERTADFKVFFSFFAPDFSLGRQNDVYWLEKGNGMKLHRFYSEIPEPQELTKAKARATELRGISKPTQKQRIAGIVKTVIGYFPIVFAVLCAGALLLWALSGAEANESMGDLAMMYEFMTSSLFVFVSMLLGIITAGLMATGILRMFLAPQLISAEEVRRGIEAQRELEQLENDPQIRKIQQDYRRRRALEVEQVTAWQEEWFEVFCLKNPSRN